jgi:hypothetical protein
VPDPIAALPDPIALLGPVIFVGIDCHELDGGGLRTAIVGMNDKLECALLEQRDGVEWIPAWRGQHQDPIRGIAVDSSRHGGLIAPQPGLEGVTAYTVAMMADATVALRAALTTHQITFLQRSEALDQARKAGRRRFLPGGIRWAWWNPGDADLSPLIALTLAHALASIPPPEPFAEYGPNPFSDDPGPDIQRRGGIMFPTFRTKDGGR